MTMLRATSKDSKLTKMNPLWTTEFRLSRLEVAKIVQSNTQEPANRLQKLGDGSDFICFLVDDKWVFRFPKSATVVPSFVQEHVFLQHLRLPIDVPSFEYWLEKPKGFHLPIAGYRHLCGTSLLDAAQSNFNVEQIAAQMGTVMRALHSQPHASSISIQDPVVKHAAVWDSNDYRELISSDLLNHCESLILSYKTQPMVLGPVTTHGDLGAEHILLDERGTPTAILDWTDVRQTSPIVDFIWAWAWQGDLAVQLMADSYGLNLPALSWRQIRTLGTIYLTHLISWETERNGLIRVSTAHQWLQQRVQSGELENSGRPQIWT